MVPIFFMRRHSVAHLLNLHPLFHAAGWMSRQPWFRKIYGIAALWKVKSALASRSRAEHLDTTHVSDLQVGGSQQLIAVDVVWNPNNRKLAFKPVAYSRFLFRQKILDAIYSRPLSICLWVGSISESGRLAHHLAFVAKLLINCLLSTIMVSIYLIK